MFVTYSPITTNITLTAFYFKLSVSEAIDEGGNVGCRNGVVCLGGCQLVWCALEIVGMAWCASEAVGMAWCTSEAVGITWCASEAVDMAWCTSEAVGMSWHAS